jgi:hypothetical protein
MPWTPKILIGILILGTLIRIATILPKPNKEANLDLALYGIWLGWGITNLLW